MFTRDGSWGEKDADRNQISTNLPATEEAFINSKPEKSLPLAAVMSPDGASTLSSFGGVVLTACLFGRNLTHLHRADTEDNDHDLNGEFWKRHRALDNILLNTSLSLPPQLRLPAGINDANIVFLNMNIHASTICLHQAAIFKADKNLMASHISGESKRRCIIAADQIANIMKLVSHIDLSTVSRQLLPRSLLQTNMVQMNPFIAFCLYVAARVFVQYLKTHTDDEAIISSLQFVLGAMQALKMKNPLTESFLVQLDVDLECSGLRVPATSDQPSMALRVLSSKSMYMQAGADEHDCSPLLDIREAKEREPACAPPPRPILSRATSGNPVEVSRIPPMQMQTHPGCFMHQSSDSPQSPPRDPLIVGLSPTYGERSGPMDMDQPFDNPSSHRFPSQTDSGHPTPSISPHNSSSQHSFSPPNPEDHPTLTSTSSLTGMSPGTASSAAGFPSQPAFPSFDPNFADIAKVPVPGGVQNPFAMPSAWTYSDGRLSSGGTAGDFELTGMPSGDVQSWQPTGTVQGNEWLFQNWNGGDTYT